VILEERVVEGRLAGDGHTVYDVSIRALFDFSESVFATIKKHSVLNPGERLQIRKCSIGFRGGNEKIKGKFRI
jgi:hypothetical protein